MEVCYLSKTPSKCRLAEELVQATQKTEQASDLLRELEDLRARWVEGGWGDEEGMGAGEQACVSEASPL